MPPKIVNKIEKKQQIIFSAMKIFAEKGISKTKIIDIAKEANIGKGTFYEYFKSKDDIFEQILNTLVIQIQTQFKRIIEQNLTPNQKLKEIFNLSLSMFLNDQNELGKIMIDFWSESIRNKNSEKLGTLEKFYYQSRESIIKILDEGVAQNYFDIIDTEITASIFIGVMDGLFLQWLMNKELLNFDSIADKCFYLFLNGIKKRG